MVLTNCNFSSLVVAGLWGPFLHGAGMTPMFASFATTLVLLAGDGLAGNVSTAAPDSAEVGFAPVIDIPAPRFPDTDDGVRRGGQAARIELDDTHINNSMSAWYRLTYIDGGTRLQVFEHSAATTRGPESDTMHSETVAWRLANEAIGQDGGTTTSDQLPLWARILTGNQTGSSAGLMFTLAYIDALTPGPLIGDLRIAGTGGIGPDGVVTPASGIDTKIAAAMLTRPDVVFTTSAPDAIGNIMIVESEHTRLPTAGRTVGEWLNVTGFEQAGRVAAIHPETTAVVVVHDLRQALAWLCGRTDNTTTCSAAHTTATIPIGTP
jgi:hypothetical protein